MTGSAKQSSIHQRFWIASSLALPYANASRFSQAVTFNFDTSEPTRLIDVNASANIE